MREVNGLYDLYLGFQTTLPCGLATKPYSTKYKVPNFQKFDGCKRNTKEHVVRFIDSMDLNPQRGPVPPSTLYVLNRSSIHMAHQFETEKNHDWEHMMLTFNTKIFYVRRLFTLVSQNRQYQGEDLDLYVRRCHKTALELWSSLRRRSWWTSASIGMVNEYYVHLKNLSFPFFSKMMEASWWTNESARRTSTMRSASRFNFAIRLFLN